MLTVALASVPTMITVLIGILINNARLSDLKASSLMSITVLTT